MPTMLKKLTFLCFQAVFVGCLFLMINKNQKELAKFSYGTTIGIITKTECHETDDSYDSWSWQTLSIVHNFQNQNTSTILNTEKILCGSGSCCHFLVGNEIELFFLISEGKWIEASLNHEFNAVENVYFFLLFDSVMILLADAFCTYLIVIKLEHSNTKRS